MKLSLNFKGAPILETLKKNISVALWGFIILVALMASYIIFKEVTKISQVRSDTSGITGQTVRVNLQQHQELEKRFIDNERFVPQATPGSDAFGAAPTNIPNR